MAAVSQKIPNLLGGVSQQPDPVKLPGQVREAINVYLDPTFGCRKRPGTEVVATLATDVPEDARWFTIFRDNDERYAVALYNAPALTLRVWDINDGSERSVVISDSATAYLAGAKQDDVEQITIADYTLLTNVNREISMSGTSSDEAVAEAFVTIDQIAYNTSYSIDIQKDADAVDPVKVYQATGLEVIPGSYEDDDGGACSDVDAKNFSINDGTDKTGLNFRLVNQCQAYLKNDTNTTYFVEDVATVSSDREIWNNIPDSRWTEDFGDFKVYFEWDDDDDQYNPPPREGDSDYDEDESYDYPYLNVRVRDSNEVSSRPSGNVTGDRGTVVRITETRDETTEDKRYVSRYSTDVLLQNGGQGWRKGDTVNVTMKGKSFKVRVTKDRFTYAYASAGSVSFTTPADTESGTLDMSLVVDSLSTAVDGLSGFSSNSVGNTIRITSTQYENFNISVRGGTTDKAMTAIKGTAQDVADLPAQCFDGTILKVNNTEESDADDYYVVFRTGSSGGVGAGSWEETVAPGILTNLNSSTMPHALIRQADGSFTLDALNSDSAFDGWAPREVGDEKTNPKPSFVGRTISNMFFFSNRLGFLSEDAVVMSQPGDYFNFFSTSALTISDADPIDLTASSTKPAILKAAVPTAKGLVLFAERSQFLLASEEVVFASSTAKLTEISNYFYRSNVLPMNTGISIAFVSENETYAKVQEMAIDSIENRPVVADITRVIPEYLPPDFQWEEASPNNNMIFMGDGSTDVYIFKFLNNGDKRQMAGWTKWTYPVTVKDMASEDDTLYIIGWDGVKHTLLKSQLVDDPDVAPVDVGFSRFSPRLDFTITNADCTSTEQGVKTRVDLPSDVDVATQAPRTVMVVSGPLSGYFETVEIKRDGTGIYFVSDTTVATSPFVFGLGYTSRVELPSIFVTQENKADRVNIPQVTFMYLDLYYSGRYDVSVTKLGYPTYNKTIEVTPANVYDANEAPVVEIGIATVPIFSAGNIVKATISAPDPYPSAVTGYSWEGSYNNRGIAPLQ